MKLVICLIAGFALSLGTLSQKTGKKPMLKYSQLTRVQAN